MRLLLNTLIALTVIGVLAGVIMHNRKAEDAAAQQKLARAEVSRFQQQVYFQAALADGDRDELKYPATIDPEWFNGDLPQNPLLGPEHPWVEIASEAQRTLSHPPDRTALDDSVAAFWYNPYAGIVRARVPVGISDVRALELYNDVNGCYLTSLFVDR